MAELGGPIFELVTVKSENSEVLFDEGYVSDIDDSALEEPDEQMTIQDLIDHIEECMPYDHWVEFPARMAKDLLVKLKAIT